VSERDEFELPVYGQHADEGVAQDEPSCSPSVYVSNEEAAVVRTMREIKERATVVRERLTGQLADDDRNRHEDELDELRRRFSDLSMRREAAYRRKMVMLGHLPPEALIE
jgi:hypothetical protein